ncbi:hypothetical protein JCM8097_005822 [Rhodosporidiobolus ruineniae]
MTAPDRVTVHTYRPPGAPSPSSADVDERRLRAEQFLARCAAPARTSRTDAAVHLDDTIRPTPGTTAYQAVLPDALSPKKLKNTGKTRAADPERDDLAAVPAFSHWNPSTTAPASSSSSSRRRPRPSSPPLPPEPPASLLPLPPQTQTQGILRKRSTGVGVAGAWAPSATAAGREKKKVRVESPRTSTARESATGVGTRRSARLSGVERVREVEEGLGGARVLVPATPEEAGRKHSENKGEERPELADGAVERCIPYPYRHTETIECSNPNPPRQHPSRILHSFVDPSFSASLATAPPARSASSSLLRPASMSRTHSGSSQFQHLPALSPLTYSYLAPGRRGSWLVPLSGPLPIPHTSSARWFTSSPPPTRAPRTASAEVGEPPPPPPIDWTDDRLKALWSFLDTMHRAANMGSLRATCFVPPSSSSAASSPSAGTSASPSSALPSYIKVTTDAHLALAFRMALDTLNVRAMDVGEEKEKGKAREKSADRETFLKGRALVWVDEIGRAVLIA